MPLPRFRATPGRVHLFNLKPAPHSQKNQKRVGRGDGSKRGGTSGRGNKGQKARSGAWKPGKIFEGGQTTISERFPKKGFTNYTSKTWAPVNLDRIQHWIDQGRLRSSPDKPITARELLESGCIHQAHDGVKLLGDGAGKLKTSIYIMPSRASQSAIKAVEKLGGYVFCKYYNDLALRDLLKGHTEHLDAAPTRRKDIQWYMSWHNRGYLSSTALGKNPMVQERWKELNKQLSRYKSEKFFEPFKQ